MTETMKVKIALIVGSNGKAAASTLPDCDWGLLADCIMEWDGNDAKDPDASAKHIVEVEVPLPAITTITGTISEEKPE